MMLLNTLALALAAPFSIAIAMPVSTKFQVVTQSPSDLSSGAVGSDSYTQYYGDGSAASGWPTMDQWVSFQHMFDSNAEIMKTSCTGLFHLPPGSDTSDVEIGQIWNAIQTTAQQTGVDHRFILAVMMQESAGCVRVWTTNNAVNNPGLMQDHAGTHSCNPGGPHESWGLVNPCPADQIQGMIQDGVSGTTAGDGLAGLLSKATTMSGGALDGSSAQLYYQAARAYNSGQFDRTDLNNRFSSTRCYDMDIANRLTGWVTAKKLCTEPNGRSTRTRY